MYDIINDPTINIGIIINQKFSNIFSKPLRLETLIILDTAVIIPITKKAHTNKYILPFSAPYLNISGNITEIANTVPTTHPIKYDIVKLKSTSANRLVIVITKILITIETARNINPEKYFALTIFSLPHGNDIAYGFQLLKSS